MRGENRGVRHTVGVAMTPAALLRVVGLFMYDGAGALGLALCSVRSAVTMVGLQIEGCFVLAGAGRLLATG
jgi:hypothetical protein